MLLFLSIAVISSIESTSTYVDCVIRTATWQFFELFNVSTFSAHLLSIICPEFQQLLVALAITRCRERKEHTWSVLLGEIRKGRVNDGHVRCCRKPSRTIERGSSPSTLQSPFEINLVSSTNISIKESNNVHCLGILLQLCAWLFEKRMRYC